MRRRQWLLGLGAAAVAPWAAAAPALPDARGLGPWRVAQVLDMSPAQQELSRDYATGVQVALAELAAAQRPVPKLDLIPTDGSAQAVQEAVARVQDDPRQLALLGVAGEGAALHCMAALATSRAELACIAPWLADTRFDSDPRLVPLFASRRDQLRQVLQQQSMLGVREMALVYPDAAAAQRGAEGAKALARELSLALPSLAPAKGQSIEAFARGLPATAPYFLVFMGGALELAQFARGLEQRDRQRMRRFVISLSDADPGIFQQAASGVPVSVAFTQVVPPVRGGRHALTLAYRRALSRYFDEEPTPMSLAGYVAGRYMGGLLGRLGAGVTRGALLAEVRQRRAVDVEGWTLDFRDGQRGSAYVEQWMLRSGHGASMG